MKTVIALLPMKGNSERVPNKNLKLFDGKPLYHKIVELLIASDYVEKIIVDTDGAKIKQDILENFASEIKIVDRPKALCGDFKSMNEIINYDLFQVSEEHFLQVHSTSPLIGLNTLNKAIETYFANLGEYDSLFSVNRHQTRLYDKEFKPINHDLNNLIRTQDLDPIYEENSNFYVFSKASFKRNNNNRIGLKPYLFPVNKMESLDIDELVDFELAELISRYAKNG